MVESHRWLRLIISGAIVLLTVCLGGANSAWAQEQVVLTSGKLEYQHYCASCHGPNGKGDGAMALSGGTPSDLTDNTWDYGSTDGEIFAVIRDGVSSDMLAYKEKLSEKQIWQLVNFIRSIGPKTK